MEEGRRAPGSGAAREASRGRVTTTAPGSAELVPVADGRSGRTGPIVGPARGPGYCPTWAE